jgi:hypothetical protein
MSAVSFVAGTSEEEREMMTSHLLTGVVCAKVVGKVVEKAVTLCGNEAARRLRELWTEKLSQIGGLPQQKAEVQSTFDTAAVRRNPRLTLPLPPVDMKGLLHRPAVFMQRPVIETSGDSTSNKSRKVEQAGVLVERTYVMKSVSIDCMFSCNKPILTIYYIHCFDDHRCIH